MHRTTDNTNQFQCHLIENNKKKSLKNRRQKEKNWKNKSKVNFSLKSYT